MLIVSADSPKQAPKPVTQILLALPSPCRLVRRGVVFAVMRQLTGWRYLMYMAGDRTLNADASPNRKVTGYEKN